MDGAFKLKLLYDYQTMDRELSKLVGIRENLGFKVAVSTWNFVINVVLN